MAYWVASLRQYHRRRCPLLRHTAGTRAQDAKLSATPLSRNALFPILRVFFGNEDEPLIKRLSSENLQRVIWHRAIHHTCSIRLLNCLLGLPLQILEQNLFLRKFEQVLLTNPVWHRALHLPLLVVRDASASRHRNMFRILSNVMLHLSSSLTPIHTQPAIVGHLVLAHMILQHVVLHWLASPILRSPFKIWHPTHMYARPLFLTRSTAFFPNSSSIIVRSIFLFKYKTNHLYPFMPTSP